MAWQGRIGQDLTSDEVRKAAKGGESPEKFIYPDGQTPEDLAKILPEDAPVQVPEEGLVTEYGSEVFSQHLGTHPIRISPLGEVTILPPGSTSFSHPSTALDVARVEKDGILRDKLAWKASGWNIAQRGKPGEGGRMPEWDHVALFSLTRDEASKIQFTPDVMKEVLRIVVDEARRPQKLGAEAHDHAAKEMFLMPVHFDQDNVHLQAFINRIGWNPTGKRTYAVEKDTGVWDGMRTNVNARLKAAGIPITLYGEPSAVMSRKADMADAQATAKVIEEMGADVPPELTQGPTKERVFKLVEQPELEKYETDITAELLETTRRQSLLAGALKQVQGAKALYIENAALKDQKTALEGNLASTQETLASTSDDLDEAKAEIETLGDQVNSATAKIADQIDQIDALSAEKAELQSELEEIRQQLAHADRALEQEQAGRKADAAAAAKREAEAAKREVEQKAAYEKIGKELSELQASHERQRNEIDRISDAFKQAQQATEAVVGELEQERASFATRARAWAEENVAAPLRQQIEALRSELAEARNDFLKQMQDAQQSFMSQMRELTAAFRPAPAPAVVEQPAAPQPRQRQWPTWTRKPFGELSTPERTAAQKVLDSEIAAGRQQAGLKLEDFHRVVHDRWQKAQQTQADNQDGGPKPRT